jgi:dihydrofolate reductase
VSDPVAIPLAVVAAIADNGVIGRGNRLIWRLRSDLKRFRAITMGKPVIMGRLTWLSIGRPLPGRHIIVLSGDGAFAAEGVAVAPSLSLAIAIGEAIAARRAAEEIIVAGGASVYAQALPLAERLHLTLVHAEPEGDAFFPACDRSRFREVARADHPAGPDDEHPFSFVDYIRTA